MQNRYNFKKGSLHSTGDYSETQLEIQDMGSGACHEERACCGSHIAVHRP